MPTEFHVKVSYLENATQKTAQINTTCRAVYDVTITVP